MNIVNMVIWLVNRKSSSSFSFHYPPKDVVTQLIFDSAVVPYFPILRNLFGIMQSHIY